MSEEQGEKPTRTKLLPPENYNYNSEASKSYPNYQVAEVISGAGTFAPHLGAKLWFSTEEEAKGYLDQQRRDGFPTWANLFFR